jgi:hypothetical protein
MIVIISVIKYGARGRICVCRLTHTINLICSLQIIYALSHKHIHTICHRKSKKITIYEALGITHKSSTLESGPTGSYSAFKSLTRLFLIVMIGLLKS